MNQLIPSFVPPSRVLLGPGPSDVPPRVLAAMGSPTIGHLDPEYLRVMDETRRMLREVFCTQNELTIAISGTGSAGMEAAVVNVVEPGDEVMVCVNGVFGTRMRDVMQRSGAVVHSIEAEWGQTIEPGAVAEAIKAHPKVKVLGIVHAETSTGAHQPLEEISKMVHGAGGLLLVDAVTSLGGAELKVDEWKIDVCYSGTQKCLSCPPGLSPMTFSAAAVGAIEKRKTKVQSWYLDVSMLRQYWGEQRVYHHTAPINMNYALHEALRVILEEGLEKRIARHTLNHQALRAGLEAMGMSYVPKHSLTTLNAVHVPAGVDDAKSRKRLLEEFGIEIGAGLGPFKGKAWRIGLMGHSSTERNVILVLSALETILVDGGGGGDAREGVGGGDGGLWGAWWMSAECRVREAVTTLKVNFLEELRGIVGDEGLLTAAEELRTYECDGLTNFRKVPVAVVLPREGGQVQKIVALCHQQKVPFVARGSGTGLSGGAMPAEGGIVISLARLNRILAVDIANGRVVVEPGVINAQVTAQVADAGYFYAPDPSSQSVCTIGGNIAENSGGAHCLKYGFTTTHVLAMKVVLPDGSVVNLGASTWDAPGYDLRGVFVGSEGTLGIATEITLRVVKRPETVQTLLAAFHHMDHTGEAVSRIIAAGILPAAAEIMDRLSIQASEAAVHAGYPMCEGLLLVELDGMASEVDLLMGEVKEICRACGAWELRLARSQEERQIFWKGRKAAFAAMGRISPNYIVQDGVIPRTALPETLRAIQRLSEAAGLRVANVFHAGDGNLHPLVLYDRKIEGQEVAAEKLAADILRLCIKAGGSITGEHGVGFEKKAFMPEMYAEPDLEVMMRLRGAFDELGICNPGKIFPRPRLCAERAGRYEPHPLETAGAAELF